MNQTSAIVFAAVLLAAVALLSIVASCVALVLQARWKLKSDLDLEQARFDFEKRLAYVRARLDKAAADWRRRADAAEVALTDFYETDAFLREVRERPAGATRTFTDYRAIKTAIDRKQDFFLELKMRRLQAHALFGASGAVIYELLLQIIEDVRYASHVLAEAAYTDREMSAETRAQLESTIWAAPKDNNDPIAARLLSVLQQAEDLFAPALGTPAQESEP